MSECPLVAHRMSGRGGCPGAFRELFGREETLSLVLLSFSVWGGGAVFWKSHMVLGFCPPVILYFSHV